MAFADRFKGFEWFKAQSTSVIIGGAGGIGSWLTLLLSRAGFSPTVYDFDTVEEHNIGGQLFRISDVGGYKAVALANIVKEYAGAYIYVENEAFTREGMGTHYMFSAFDNMKARRDMFTVWKEEVVENWLASYEENKGILKADESIDLSTKDYSQYLPGEQEWRKQEEAQELEMRISRMKVRLRAPLFIDGRLTGEQLQIFCVTPDDIEEYEKHLFDDKLVADAPCTTKQTSHSAAMIAAHMVGFFTNHLTNEISGDKERVLPFFWEYYIPLNYVSTTS